jgi:flagellar FliJ protein
LIRISTHDVETLQKRLSEIVDRRVGVEMRMAVLEAQAEDEKIHAQGAPETRMALAAFLVGVKHRRQSLMADLDQIAAEEAGARDALAQAFETLKKFEMVAETARLAADKETARREIAAMDELALRARPQ